MLGAQHASSHNYHYRNQDRESAKHGAPSCNYPATVCAGLAAGLEQLRGRVALQTLQFTSRLGCGKTCDMEGVLVVGHLDATPGANRLNLPHRRIWEA